jgi:small subunit ribosomal protein S6
MNRYESVIIMKPDVEIEVSNRIVATIEGIVENLDIDNIGIKKLAYRIKEYEEGYYMLFTFNCEPNKIEELEGFYRIEDNIIKFITVRIDDEEED